MELLSDAHVLNIHRHCESTERAKQPRAVSCTAGASLGRFVAYGFSQ
jgi:hypothetical protein